MNKSIFWRFLFIGLAIAAAAVFFLPNTPLFKGMPEWWQKNLPNRGIVLGLDLQGGLHLVFEVEADKAVDQTVERYAYSIREALQKKKLQAEVKKNGLDIEVSPAGQDVLTALKEGYSNLDTTASGQTAILRLNDKEKSFIKDNASNQALETIRNRVDQFGVAEPTIHRQGTNEIVVQLPGVKDPKRAIDLIGKTALLEFKIVDDESPIAAQLPASVAPGEEGKILEQFAAQIPEGDQILFEKKVNRETGAVTKFPILLKKETVLTGALLSEARGTRDTQFSTPHVSITFNPVGANRFEEITAANVKKRMAII
ncbi:MAG: protein translocase subunit SecD, partial [Nitrospirae bacterium]|nr:protein translocase subunit SecD [Nitrospirota bacterium]